MNMGRRLSNICIECLASTSVDFEWNGRARSLNLPIKYAVQQLTLVLVGNHAIFFCDA